MSLGLPSHAQAGHWSEAPQALPGPWTQVRGKGEGTALPLRALAPRDTCTPITKATSSPWPVTRSQHCHLQAPVQTLGQTTPHPTWKPPSKPGCPGSQVLPGCPAGPISTPRGSPAAGHPLLPNRSLAPSLWGTTRKAGPRPHVPSPAGSKLLLKPRAPSWVRRPGSGHRVGEPHGHRR